MNQKSDKTKSLINHGGELAGSAIGAALGFLASGPIGLAAGAAAGTALGKAITSIGSDIHDSYISPKEEMRIGAGVAIALADISDRLNSGEKIRDDGFFNENSAKRSDAEDILEGTLLKCKTSYEERKVQYGGKFFSNISFRDDIDINRASYFLQVFEKLTYRQLCLMNLFCRIGNPTRDHDLTGKNVTGELWSILQEVQDIKDLNLIYQGDHKQELRTTWGLGSLIPAWLYATNLGHNFYQVFSLDKIPEEDVLEVVQLLK
ncbi:hypothetical protein TUM4261_21080 [Shewanella sp. c952]|uniref:hypothetical protein n=1 Tax=Shewanella sp. c952 TaxID=2815913 RepID=UPI001BBB0129|nr:hypothetical protein [Shewanella sp. c952]GIU10679.1 hypothetical protein TUM4261_21080 [Shewanella sp. c952]